MSTTSAFGTPASHALLLPWVPAKTRRSSICRAAAPLLIAALRRVFAVPTDTRFFDEDLKVLDAKRPTLKRLHAARRWNEQHPYRSRPFLHSLLHAGYVLRGCHLSPSHVHDYQRALRRPATAPDEDLLTCAHLSVSSPFGPTQTGVLVNEHDWTIADISGWADRFPEDPWAHYTNCLDAGYKPAELGVMVRAEQVPTPQQVEMLLVLQRPAPPPAAA